MTTTTNLTVQKLKTWARANRDLALTTVKARAFAELERERVDAYIAPVFARYGFTNDYDGGSALAHPDKLYLSKDEERCKAYFAECDRVHREHGFTGPDGHCPALTAEDLQRQAENLLLDSLAAFLGVDGFYASIDLRAKALEIALGACLVDAKTRAGRERLVTAALRR